MSRWLTFLLLISCNCVTCSETESPCRGFNGATSDVRGGIGEHISMACHVPTNCTRRYWKYDDTIKAKLLLPGEYSGDTYYLFSFNSSKGIYTLNIYNINGCVAGFYTCLCYDLNGSSRPSTHACFNLSVNTVQCSNSVQINNKNRVLDRCIVTNKMETIDVRLKENITIKCDVEIRGHTNCSQLGRGVLFTVNQSHHLCSFRCKQKRNSKLATCQAEWITLNVIRDVTSSSTETTSTSKTSNNITTKDKSSSVGISTTVSSPFSSSSPSEPDSTTTNKRSFSNFTFGSTTMTKSGTSITTTALSSPTSSLSVPSTLNTTDVSIQTTTLISITSTKVEKKNCENSSSACIQLETTAGNVRGSTMPAMPKITNNLLFIMIASCIILVLAIIVLILCAHITFYKKGICSCNGKEEWVNPIYESADTGAQLPVVIPDEGNTYDTVSSPRHMADFSSAMSTTNNVHQINADLGSTNEIPMVQVQALHNVAVKLLDYTVTASNVGTMELNKLSCTKIKSSAVATETLCLPKADDISSPPASPHLYEMLNDLVRS